MNSFHSDARLPDEQCSVAVFCNVRDRLLPMVMEAGTDRGIQNVHVCQECVVHMRGEAMDGHHGSKSNSHREKHIIHSCLCGFISE